MILRIRQWCEGIIIAIIICIIIECLIPEGNNKKYIKVVIGIYIMYISLSPILNLFNYDFKLENIFEIEAYEETYSSIDNELKDVYILGIEENIKEELKNFGYEVSDVKVFVDINYENIEKIEIKVENKISNEIKIEKITIGDNAKKVNNIDTDYSEMKKFLKENYFINENQIFFK